MQTSVLSPGISPFPRFLAFVACSLLVLPHLIVVVTSFDPSPVGLFPPEGVSLKWYRKAFERHSFREGFLLSLVVASAAAGFAVAAGTMAATLIVRYRFAGRGLLLGMLQSPMMIPEVVLGLGFLILFARWRMYMSLLNILLAHAVITLPFALRVILANLYTVSVSLEEAAYVLGAGPLQAFIRITLPVIKQGILAAGIFSFVVSFDNFTLTVFLVSSRGTLPVEIYSYIRTESDPTVAAISTLLIVMSIVGVLAVERVVGFESLTRTGRMGG